MDKTSDRTPTATEIVSFFDDWELSDAERAYLRYHARRFELLLSRASALAERARAERQPSPVRILDVGTGFQTELMRATIDDATVDALGFNNPTFSGDTHHWFDLNDSVDPSRWPDAGDYHLLVLAEVIEHLRTSPAAVLRCLGSMLQPGGFLLVQTPNAVALHKRLKMLFGRHPYSPLVDSTQDPMHFRENTRAELEQAGRDAGLVLEASSMHNYFDRRTPLARAYNALGAVLPATLRTGITATFRRPPAGAAAP
jgi:SAM-dependent methyltransferase